MRGELWPHNLLITLKYAPNESSFFFKPQGTRYFSEARFASFALSVEQLRAS